MARPTKKLDHELIEELAKEFCTVEEIAHSNGCSKDTIERRAKEAIERGRAAGRVSLRRLQWESARKGNITMQIWLGKQVLGQRDNLPPEDGGGRPFTLNYGLDDDE